MMNTNVLYNLIQLFLIVIVPLFTILTVTRPKLYGKDLYKQNKEFFQTTTLFYASILILNLIIFMLLGIPLMLGVTTAFTLSIAIWFLSFLFMHAQKITSQTLLRIFYYIGLVLTTFASFGLSDWYYGYDSFSNSIFNVLTQLAIMILIGTAGSIIISLILGFLMKVGPNLSSRTQKTDHHPVKKDIRDHYYEQGLNDQQINYFRDQMAPAKEQIEHINLIFNQTAKLRAIEVRHNTNKVLQNYFKDIVEEPNRLPQASTFLYKYLPSLEDLILKYNEINGHVAKNKQTYIILDKSAQTINQLCEQITDDYVLFHQETYNNLDDEIKYVRKNLKSTSLNNDEEVDSKRDFVDELIDDYSSETHYTNEEVIDDFFNTTEPTSNANPKEDK